MPNNVYVLMGSCALLGLLLLWRGFVNFLNSDLHRVRGVLQLISSIFLLILATTILTATINLSAYRNVTHETTLAKIEFEELKHDKGRFIATLDMEGDLPRRFELKGDQWQIDIRMIKWDQHAAQLGLTPLYQFDRLSGRYAEIVPGGEPTQHDLRLRKGIDLWAFAQKFANYLPFIDASYGSAAYQVMANNLKYEISLSHSGLIARRVE